VISGIRVVFAFDDGQNLSAGNCQNLPIIWRAIFCAVSSKREGHPVSRIDPSQLNWRGDWLCGPTGRRILRLVRDQQFPALWRIEQPNGERSGMMGRDAARSAARRIALAIIRNRRRIISQLFSREIQTIGRP
jgi:hypothetical protein